MKKLSLIAALCAILFCPGPTAPVHAASEPKATVETAKKKKPNDGYISELITAILEKTDGPNAAKSKTVKTTKTSRERLLLELISGETIEYTAKATQPSWEKKLIPIRIPLRKGLQGYRLFLIDRADQEEFAGIDSLESLVKLPTGLNMQWSIVPVYEAAGFQLVGGDSKPELARMLSLGRFKFFARGIDEVFFEHGKYVQDLPTLAVEQTLALQIRHPVYLFVTPKRPDLAERFERGLRMMIEDGSFDALFWKYYRDDIEAAQLHRRKVFSLPNPNLTIETPMVDQTLWLDPAAPPPPVTETISNVSQKD